MFAKLFTSPEFLAFNKALKELGCEPNCANDPEAFFPEVGGGGTLDLRMALRACAECPIKAQCLAYALESNQEHGIWGGVTPRERSYMSGRRTRPESRSESHRDDPQLDRLAS